jgi:ABC-2 type transport system ATP-binding protein
MTEAAVSVEGLTKIYRVPFSRQSTEAVHDLNLRIQPGEVYGMLGPNGSGRSTTLKIILGLVLPTRGQTKIFGRDSSLVQSRESIGFLPENPYFYKFLTGEETLRFFGKLCRLTGTRLRDRVTELLHVAGLTNARHQRLKTYSKGMLQRIGLAQALINEPKLVVLDEPTAGVDPVGSRQICDLIVDLKQRGVTILLSSHLLSQVEEVCDRVGILANGKLVREGRLEELISIENRSELVLEGASESLLQEIDRLVGSSNATIIDRRRSTATLEQLFLDVTKGNEKRDKG